MISENAINKTGSENGEIILVKHNSLDVVKVYPPERWEYPQLKEKSLCYKAILDNENKNIGDIRDKEKYPEIRDGYYNQNPPYTNTNSELVVLINPEESDRTRTLGIINFERKKKGEFSEDEVRWAELLAGQVAIAIRHQRLWEGIQTLNEITVSLATQGSSPEKVFKDIIAKIVEWTDSEDCYILEKDGNEFLILGSKDEDDFGIRVGKNSLIGHHLIEKESRDTLYEPELQKNSDLKQHLAHRKHRNVQSFLIVPLIEDGQVIGALYLDDSRKDHFPDYAIDLLKVVTRVLSKTLTATSRIVDESKNELRHKAEYILSQLENVKDNFAHKYAHNIGDSRGKLQELNKHLSKNGINPP